MDAYYYHFEPTGEELIDRILSAVASAGKAYHHTEMWWEQDDRLKTIAPFRGESYIEWIQNAADDAAAELRSFKS